MNACNSAAAVIDPQTALLPLCGGNGHSTVGSSPCRLPDQGKSGHYWELAVRLR